MACLAEKGPSRPGRPRGPAERGAARIETRPAPASYLRRVKVSASSAPGQAPLVNGPVLRRRHPCGAAVR